MFHQGKSLRRQAVSPQSAVTVGIIFSSYRETRADQAKDRTGPSGRMSRRCLRKEITEGGRGNVGSRIMKEVGGSWPGNSKTIIILTASTGSSANSEEKNGDIEKLHKAGEMFS